MVVSGFFEDVSIDGGHNVEKAQLSPLISEHSGQGAIWNKDHYFVLALKLVSPDVAPDETPNLTSCSFGLPDDGLQVGADSDSLRVPCPSRVGSSEQSLLPVFGHFFPSNPTLLTFDGRANELDSALSRKRTTPQVIYILAILK